MYPKPELPHAGPHELAKISCLPCGRVRYYTFHGGKRAERRFRREDLDRLLKPGKTQEP
jgi:hypothetical protein